MQFNTLPYKKVDYEGVDGSGKSSQFEMTKAALSSRHAVFSKEPYMRHPSGPEIYEILTGKHPEVSLASLSLFDFQRRYFANRIVHYRELVLPTLAEGRHLVADRGPASMCYGVASPDDFAPLMELQESDFAQAGVPFLWPDAILIYDVPVEVAMARMVAGGKVLDLHETEAKLTVVRENYLEFARRYPNCHVIDGTRSPEEVFPETQEILAEIFEK